MSDQIQKIADTIGALIPGENGQVLCEQDNEPSGDLASVGALAKWCRVHADDLLKYAGASDVRRARLAIVELEGALNAAKQEIDAAAEQGGLPPLGG
jgi:hypothetical protein